MEPKKKSQPKKKEKATYNKWEFLRDFTNNVFNLINSGKIFPTFGLLLLILMGMVIWRLPASDLAKLSSKVLDALLTPSFLFSYSIISNGIGLSLFFWQKSVYQSEINRISKIRSDLMHNIDRVAIKDHRSSDDKQDESFILPSFKKPVNPNIKEEL